VGLFCSLAWGFLLVFLVRSSGVFGAGWDEEDVPGRRQ
jgi:hypothetical protein